MCKNGNHKNVMATSNELRYIKAYTYIYTILLLLARSSAVRWAQGQSRVRDDRCVPSTRKQLCLLCAVTRGRRCVLLIMQATIAVVLVVCGFFSHGRVHAASVGKPFYCTQDINCLCCHSYRSLRLHDSHTQPLQ